MQYKINQRDSGEDELVLNYKEMNPEVEAVIAFMEKRQKKMTKLMSLSLSANLYQRTI